MVVLAPVQSVTSDIVGHAGGNETGNGLTRADPLPDVRTADVQKRGGNAACENSPEGFFAYRLAEGTEVARFWSGSG